jgi:UDP-N-acetylglucosamine:LPS N-acetylglucosamine transferase
MKAIELVYCDAGGGHRSAANALRDVAGREQRPWSVRQTNLLQLFAELDVWRKLTGVAGEEGYNGMLRRGWTLGSPLMLRVFHSVVRRSHASQVALLERHWRTQRPDVVVSFIPHFNRALYDAMQRAIPGVPLVTILTDLADSPPHFWIERGQSQYFVCGTALAREQALAAGHPDDRVFQTSGMILNPRFYDPAGPRDRGELAALGLDPALPTALVMFGGFGSASMRTIVRRLDASGLGVQVIAVCGRNERLEASLRAMPLRIPAHITGFVPDVARLMRSADFFIGKPGPGSISEALAMGLPVIVERNAWTMPQERYNAEWIEEQGVGIAISSFRRNVVAAVATMIDPDQRAHFTACVGGYRNRAVFEIPAILEQVLEGAQGVVRDAGPFLHYGTRVNHPVDHQETR